MDTWQALVADKKHRQQASIPKDWLITTPPDTQLDVTGVPAACGILTPFELEITEMDDVGLLLHKLAVGELSSVDATRAFYKRAIIAQQVTNCLTEIFVDRALARAAECDEYLKTQGKPMGALHGLPISLKDQFCIKGLEATIGFVWRIGKYAENDASLVTILYEAGAVPFVRTNIPQTLMWTETFNNIFGRTVNPFNRNLTCGGSSGGEGALVAMKGSPLGVGSDIAGSIRVPSAFNGLFGLRPSANRLPYEGLANSMEGFDSVPPVLGPMTRSVSGVKAFTKAVIDSEPWRKDPLAIREVWDEDAYQLKGHGNGKDLCFAIMWNNGCVLPHPPIRRALEETKTALEAKGFKVIYWPEFNYEELCTPVLRMWAGGAGEDFAAHAAKSSEPLHKTMAPDGKSLGVEWLPQGVRLSVYESWQLQNKKTEMRKKHLDLWESTTSLTGTGRPVDAIITPAAAYAAVPHGKNIYTMTWNVLDYTTCIFPVSKVDPVVDVKQPRADFFNDVDKTIHSFYEPEIWKNAPVALQLVGRTLEEEAVIRMTEIVDGALKLRK